MDNFIIYIATAILLIVFIFLLPGIALFPKFIFNPRTAAAIPFISISVIVSTQYLLRILGQFYQANLIIFLLFVSLIASFRLFKIFKIPKNFNNYWKRNDLLALFLIFLSCIPLMVILGFDGFQHADEIMSWNLWAKKIFFNEDKISNLSVSMKMRPNHICDCQVKVTTSYTAALLIGLIKLPKLFSM